MAIKLLIVAIVLILCPKASSFPEFIGKGYGHCGACHIQPSGGGPLTDYGRTASAELSTWGSETEAEEFYGLFNIRPLSVHGHARYLWYRFDDKGVQISKNFWMQRELSLSFQPAENVTFIGSAGYYGEEMEELEFRRYFALVKLGGLWARAGRFIPAFGYQIADHTKAVKELFSQGDESLNAEAGYTGRWGEIIAARLFGGQSSVKTNQRPDVTATDDKDGFAGKATLFITKGVQLGMSYARLTDDERVRTVTSYHAYAGTGFVYALAEFQSHPIDAYKAYGEIGIVPVKGLHLKAELNDVDGDRELFGGFQWLPRPHWDFNFTASYRQWYFITHYYL